MILKKFPDKRSLAPAAADRTGAIIRNSIAERGKARIIAATGASLFEFLEVPTKKPTIDWTEEASLAERDRPGRRHGGFAFDRVETNHR